MSQLIQKFIESGNRPDDPGEIKLKKSSLVVSSTLFCIAGLIWGILYFANGLMISGSIPFTYGVLSIFNLFSFSISKRYIFFRNSQLFLILILPFALQLSLGGFVQSSAVLYWAIIAPLGAMFYDSVRRSIYWFIAFICLAAIAYLIDDYILNYINHNLSNSFINNLFLLNIIGVSILIYGILYYFVSTITKLNADIEHKNIALNEQSEKLKEMDKVKSRFFANISHEFRTPLTLIMGIANKQVKNKSGTANDDGETLKRNSNRLLQLINQLLDLSKLESGEVKLSASKTDIFTLTRTLTSQFESYADDINVAFTLNGETIANLSSSPPIELYLDRDLYQKMFTNILSNALKFVPKNGIVRVEVSVSGDSAVVSVTNSGEGIPADKISHIFDRFYQVDGSTSRQYEGTGIGLSLVKELVELHHGEVSAQSSNGLTTFTLKLPLNSGYLSTTEKSEYIIEESDVENDIPSISRAESEVIDSENIGNKLEVLIVEDNADLRKLIREVLKSDYKVIEAIDGLDGYEKAIEAMPDMIISDVMMPRMDGYALCQKIKSDEATNHIPLILLTAKAARENKLEGLETGADDFLVKPFDEEELKIRIQNLISIRQQLQQKFQQELHIKPDKVNADSVHQKFINDLKSIVEENISNELFSVDDLSNQANMSRSQLHRKLKALTDQSATTFIRNYRLHRAVDLLKQNSGNVTETAYRVGFNSQTYFSSSFHELFGCSPTEYLQKGS
ncbi:MAG: response regulator [Cyclobacteriaceae bacterium]